MKELLKKIKNPDCFIEKFNSWDASIIKINEDKTVYMLKNPNSEYEKVCLYTDGHFMCVYGDYGTMTFDQMTWNGNVFNLQYDNIGYQMEKLSHESRESLSKFNDDACAEDIVDWLKEELINLYDIEDEDIDKIINGFNNISFSSDIEEFCEKLGFDEITDILTFAFNALKNTDEYEWISFLRGSNLCDFEEVCESDLWRAGMRISQRYFINMLALSICAEKLKGK